jgi:hypothetical protein
LKVLLDENVDKKLRAKFADVDIDCKTVTGIGYRGKKNGELLALVDGVYDVFVTMDKSIRKQQNFAGRRIALLLIRAPSNRIKDVLPYLHEIKDNLRQIKPGEFREAGWTIALPVLVYPTVPRFARKTLHATSLRLDSSPFHDYWLGYTILGTTLRQVPGILNKQVRDRLHN